MSYCIHAVVVWEVLGHYFFFFFLEMADILYINYSLKYTQIYMRTTVYVHEYSIAI